MGRTTHLTRTVRVLLGALEAPLHRFRATVHRPFDPRHHHVTIALIDDALREIVLRIFKHRALI